MTIGALGRSMALPPDQVNDDFVKLIKCKETLCDTLNLNPDDVDLSMGMSSDFEHAVLFFSNVMSNQIRKCYIKGNVTPKCFCVDRNGKQQCTDWKHDIW